MTRCKLDPSTKICIPKIDDYVAEEGSQRIFIYNSACDFRAYPRDLKIYELGEEDRGADGIPIGENLRSFPSHRLICHPDP